MSLPKGRNFEGLTLSPNGEKCAFIEEDDFIGQGVKMEDVSTLSNSVKVMDVKTGEMKEIVQLKDLIDRDNEEEFRKINVIGKVTKGVGPVISGIRWDKTSSSLTFNYDYISKKDGNNYTNTYVVTFDR